MSNKALGKKDITIDCPWFTNGRNAQCSCKEYTKGIRSLVLVDNTCEQHGLEQVVDNCSQDCQNGK